MELDKILINVQTSLQYFLNLIIVPLAHILMVKEGIILNPPATKKNFLKNACVIMAAIVCNRSYV